jgi:hypothetical protein
MSQYFEIHPENPQLRLIHRAVDIIRKGGVIVYPTDSSYALACHLGDKQALDKIRRIRQVDDKHNFTLVCKDLTQVATFTKIGNDGYRLINSCLARYVEHGYPQIGGANSGGARFPGSSSFGAAFAGAPGLVSFRQPAPEGVSPPSSSVTRRITGRPGRML